MTEPTPIGDQPAFPSREVHLAGTPFEKHTILPGMSLRAYVATAALQGILANPFIMREGLAGGVMPWALAIQNADSLLAELSKPKP